MMHLSSMYGPELQAVAQGDRVRTIAHLGCVPHGSTGAVVESLPGYRVLVGWDCGKTCQAWLWELRSEARA